MNVPIPVDHAPARADKEPPRRFTDERPERDERNPANATPVPPWMRMDKPATNSPTPPATRRLLSDMPSAERKKYPVATGFVDYFPDAMAAVAHVSWLGNQKHNPGQPLHWARGKSSDHDDCQMRHLIERGDLDPEGIEHMAQKAWRAMAELQEYLERKYNLSLPRGATAPGVELPSQ